MIIKKIVISTLLGLSLITSAFAGTEDWKGVYNIKFSSGQTQTLTHTSTSVQFLFMTSGKCMHLAKGSKVNGIEIKETVDLCTQTKVDVFTREVQKLGNIVSKTITLGPTYPR